MSVNLQKPKDAGMQATLPIKSKGNVSKLSAKENSMTPGKLEDLQKGEEHGDNQEPQVVHSMESTLNDGAKEPAKSTELTSLSPEQTGKALQDHENDTEVLEAAACAGCKKQSSQWRKSYFSMVDGQNLHMEYNKKREPSVFDQTHLLF